MLERRFRSDAQAGSSFALPDPAAWRTDIKVISLDAAHARRVAMAERLTRAGLDWTFFNAHRSLEGGLVYDERDAWIAKGRPLVPQELGCYSSHYGAWTDFLAGTSQQLLVLEDDVDGDWRYVKQLLPLDLAASGIHLMRLYGKYPARCQFRGSLGNMRIFQFTGILEGGQAYMLTRHGAERLVASCRRVRRPIDDAMDSGWLHGIHSFGLLPYPLLELSEPTQIPGRTKANVRNPYRVKRLLFRFNDQARKLANRALAVGGGTLAITAATSTSFAAQRRQCEHGARLSAS